MIQPRATLTENEALLQSTNELIGELEQRLKGIEISEEENGGVVDDLERNIEQKRQQLSPFARVLPEGANRVKTPEEVLRDFVFSVNNKSENRQILNYNHALKIERYLLMQVKHRIGNIEILHGNRNHKACASICLTSGFEEGDSWKVSLCQLSVLMQIVLIPLRYPCQEYMSQKPWQYPFPHTTPR